MGERVPPAVGDDPVQDNNLAIQSSSNPNGPLNSYVVQVPKDQIYHVPPPENARMVEEFRNRGAPNRKPKRPCWCKCLVWTILALFVIGIIIGINLIMLKYVTKPKAPKFSITQFSVKQSSDNSRPKYDVKLKVENKDKILGVEYGSNKEASSLSYSKESLATGSFPNIHQKAGDSSDIDLTLLGTNGLELPEKVKESIDDKKPTHETSLTLKVSSSLELNNGILKWWTRDIDVTCTFSVNTMGDGAKIKSQNCETKLL